MYGCSFYLHTSPLLPSPVKPACRGSQLRSRIWIWSGLDCTPGRYVCSEWVMGTPEVGCVALPSIFCRLHVAFQTLTIQHLFSSPLSLGCGKEGAWRARINWMESKMLKDWFSPRVCILWPGLEWQPGERRFVLQRDTRSGAQTTCRYVDCLETSFFSGSSPHWVLSTG